MNIIRKIGYSFLCSVLCLAAAGGATTGREKNGFQVIVHKSNTTPPLSKKEISMLFLKKKKKWLNGDPVLPVDLQQDSEVRIQFSKEIHDKKMPQLRAYWQRRIFTGTDVPPPEKATDEEILKYVHENRAAIGYISAQRAIDKYDVKKLVPEN